METTRWKDVRALFSAALKLPVDERKDFLSVSCQDDDALYKQVEALLAAYHEAPAFFEKLAEEYLGTGWINWAKGLYPAEAYSLIGQRLAEYEIHDIMDRGRVGLVYKAKNIAQDQLFSLRILASAETHSPDVWHTFEARATTAFDLFHPNLETLSEVGEAGPMFEDRRIFLASPFYEGVTLKQRLSQGRLSLDEAVGYAIQLAKGLEYLHDHGLIHHHLTPSSILITHQKEVKILDLALYGSESLFFYQTDHTSEARPYQSPEQVKGLAIDRRTDLWSLGVLFFQMLTGQLPFRQSQSEALAQAIANEKPIPIQTLYPRLPGDLAAIVTHCLATHPEDRYPDATPLLADLVPALQRLAAEVTAPVLPKEHKKRAPILGIGLAFLGVVVLLFAAAALLPTSRHAVLERLGQKTLPAEKYLVVLATPQETRSPDEQVFLNGLVETTARKVHLFEKTQESFWVVPTGTIQNDTIEQPFDAWKTYGTNLAILVNLERRDDQTHITLDLVNAGTHQVLRRKVINYPSKDARSLHQAITTKVASLLGIKQDKTLLPVSQTSSKPEHDTPYTNGLGYLRQTESIDAAIAAFEQILQQDSSFAPAYEGLAEAYERKFALTHEVQWAGHAEQHGLRALTLDSTLTGVHLTLGRLHLAQKAYESAQADFRRVLAKDAMETQAYLYLAKTYEATHQPAEAEAIYKQAIATKGDNWATHQALATFYSTHSRYEEALKQYRQVANLTPMNAVPFSAMGILYQRLNQPIQALRAYQQAASLNPGAQTHGQVGEAFYEIGRFKEAAQAFEQALEYDEDDFRLWGNLALAYHWMEEPEKATTAYNRATKKGDRYLKDVAQDQQARISLATFYAYQGNRQQALSLIANLSDTASLDAKALCQLAEVYEQANQRDLALRWLEKALQSGYSFDKVNTYPGFRSLRLDARFQRTAQQYGGEVL